MPTSSKPSNTAKPDITLYHYWRSSCSWRVRWALTIKGVRWHSETVNLLHGGQHSPEFLALNPAGFVPAVVTSGQAFGESFAILEWIEETWRQRPLLPQDPLSRMHVRQLCNTIVSGTQPLQNLSPQQRHSSDPAEQAAWAKHWIEKGLSVYELVLQHGRPGTYSFGGQVTLADICLVPQCYNAERYGVKLEKWPLLAGIYRRCLELPECQESAPHNQPGAQLIASAPSPKART